VAKNNAKLCSTALSLAEEGTKAYEYPYDLGTVLPDVTLTELERNAFFTYSTGSVSMCELTYSMEQ